MPVNRKLVAIVMADVVGYSRLMERDESGTHERLHHLRRELIDPKITEHSGRIVHTAGDGLLLEFPSATSALHCSVEIQRELGVRNLYIAPDDRIQYRIGINLGDIIVEGEDIIGDGVNIAARLETLAEPGGISIASAVWDQVHEDLGVEYIDSGEQHVKNISKPIRVYRVALGKGSATRDQDLAAGPTPRQSSNPWTRLKRDGTGVSPAAMTLGIAGALGAAGVGLWLWALRPHPGVAPPSVPPRSIIVLPFAAPPDDPSLRALADTLTSELTRTLTISVRSFKVAAPSVAAAYKGSVVDERKVARDANVHYVLEGDVTASGDEIAVSTRLIDGGSARELGVDRRTIARARLAQDGPQLEMRSIYAARGLVFNAERRRIAAEPTARASAQDLVDRADLLNAGEDLPSIRKSLGMYDEAIRRDPALVAAWAGRVNANLNEFLVDFTADRDRLLAAMDQDSLHAIALDDHDSLAWAARTEALTFQSRFAAAFDASERTRAIDPTSGLMWQGYLDVFSGRAADALEVVDARAAMVGRTEPSFLTLACNADLNLGNYDNAISECERAATGIDTYWIYALLTAAAAQAGDMDKAAMAKAELMRRIPDFTIARLEAKKLSTDPTWLQQIRAHMIPGLRKAGVPE